MGDFDKKRTFSIIGIIIGAGTFIGWAVGLVANYYQAKEGMEKSKNSENTTSIVETVEKTTKATKAKQAEKTIVEEENIEEVPPTEPQPTAVYLDSLKVAESRGFYENESSAEDTIGNIYIGHVLSVGKTGIWEDINGNDYVTYYLGGKYKKLSGTIAVNDKTGESSTGELLILCDDNSIYTTGFVGRTTAPIILPDELSVEGCQWLKISVTCSDSRLGRLAKTINFILSDFKLEE